MEPTADTFRARLKEARIASRLSQAALAKRVGVSTAAVSKWEQGASFPEVHNLEKLAAELKQPLVWFLSASQTDREADDVYVTPIRSLRDRRRSIEAMWSDFADGLREMRDQLVENSLRLDSLDEALKDQAARTVTRLDVLDVRLGKLESSQRSRPRRRKSS